MFSNRGTHIPAMLAAVLVGLFFLSHAIAGVGDSDNRYYVTDEMWAQAPYDKFVYFEVMSAYGQELVPAGHCSAQYISPNLILSAGHCTDEDAQGYRVTNYKKEQFLVELIETPYDGRVGHVGDWAVWLVTDPKYYSDAYFNLKIPTKTMDVMNAGWGWARIISDKEIETIRAGLEIIKEMYEKDSIDINDVRGELNSYLVGQNISILTEKPSKLKASECKIIFEDCFEIALEILNGQEKIKGASDRQQNKLLKSIKKQENKLKNVCNMQIFLEHTEVFPQILATTCDSWGGNSGGGYVSSDGKYLYGVCSFGGDDFTDKENTDYITSTLQFENRIKELIKTFDSKNPVAENIAKVPKNNFDDEIIILNTESDDSYGEQRILQRMDRRIKKLTEETDSLDKSLMSELSNVQNMTDGQLLKFVDKMAEHEVKSDQLEELQKAYDAAVAREQSLGNRVLGAVSIGTTGIGGMELASGLAEKRADEDAERDMKVYLETIKCDYGQGLNIKGGETNIELPGGNELAELYSQYTALAADLKARKESLGLKPGLESELILDKSSTGLYDDVGIGITSGAYASVSRALMDENGDDAAAWNAQKEESQKKIKAGAIAAGAGAGVGTVGNLIEDATYKKRNSANQN